MRSQSLFWSCSPFNLRCLTICGPSSPTCTSWAPFNVFLLYTAHIVSILSSCLVPAMQIIVLWLLLTQGEVLPLQTKPRPVEQFHANYYHSCYNVRIWLLPPLGYGLYRWNVHGTTSTSNVTLTATTTVVSLITSFGPNSFPKRTAQPGLPYSKAWYYSCAFVYSNVRIALFWYCWLFKCLLLLWNHSQHHHSPYFSQLLYWSPLRGLPSHWLGTFVIEDLTASIIITTTTTTTTTTVAEVSPLPGTSPNPLPIYYSI
jgi:hypothetical protein